MGNDWFSTSQIDFDVLPSNVNPGLSDKMSLYSSNISSWIGRTEGRRYELRWDGKEGRRGHGDRM